MIIDIITTATAFTCLILKGKETGSSLLTLTISGIILNSWMFNEAHFNGFIFDKLQLKNIIAEINTCFLNQTNLYYIIFFFIKHL